MILNRSYRFADLIVIDFLFMLVAFLRCLKLGIMVLISTTLLLILLKFSIQASGNEHSVELPSLWSKIWITKSYHIIYQMEVAGTDELMTIEEWASFNQQTIRIDLISGVQRTSYLTYGSTGERFRYRPYTCDLLKSEAEDFKWLSELFLGYPLNKSTDQNESAEIVLAYGLGPLWLRARGFSSKVQLKSGNQDDGHEFKSEFEEYQVTLRQDIRKNQVPFELKFYFPKSVFQFVDSIDWVVLDDGGIEEVVARAKVLRIDLQTVDDSAFKLPVGYGCDRLIFANQSKSFDIPVWMTLLHRGTPNQVNMDITMSRPINALLSSWQSRRYSVSVMRDSRIMDWGPAGTDDLESYFASETQERSEIDGRLRTTKKVWWLPHSHSREVLSYKIDQESGKCTIAHSHYDNVLELSFSAKDAANRNAEIEGIFLSLEEIIALFNNNDGFRLIDEGESLAKGKFRNRVYERRASNYTFLNDSFRNWRGSVSIVKQISSAPKYMDQLDKTQKGQRASREMNLADDYRTTIILYLYNDPADTLLYKVSIDLIGNHEVDLSYVHEQLDVTPCYEPERKKEITIKYPIESEELFKKLMDKQRQITTQLYANLFYGSQSFLSPLQITNTRTSYDEFYLKVQMTLIDLPLVHTFDWILGQKILAGSGQSRGSAVEFVASNVEKCSEYCAFRNCRKFSYDRKTMNCVIELSEGEATAAPEPTSDLFIFNAKIRSVTLASTDKEKSGFTSKDVIQLFERLTADRFIELDEPSSDDSLLNLEFQVQTHDQAGTGVKMVDFVLRPSSIESNLESMNEYVREEREADGATGDDKAPTITILHEGGYMKHEYNLIAHDAKFQDDVGQKHASVTYEDCAQKCSEIDCRSFSYCQQTKECRLTQIGQQKFIAKYVLESQAAERCDVFALDSLSKFESFGESMKPAEIGVKVLSGHVRSVQDCAGACMDDQSIACQGFYYCERTEPGKSLPKLRSCYLSDKHVADMNSKEVASRLPSSELKDEKGNGRRGARWGGGSNQKREPNDDQGVCTYYSRSYLAQFDKYLGMKIRNWDDRKRLLMGTNTESCAKRCIELNCLAFSVCPPTNRVYLQRCLFVTDQIRKDQLESDQDCSSFILSDRSHFNKKGVRLIENGAPRADVEANPGGGLARAKENTTIQDGEQTAKNDSYGRPIEVMLREDENPTTIADQLYGDSHWLSRIFHFVCGLLMGSCFILAWDEAYAHGWLTKTTRFVAHQLAR